MTASLGVLLACNTEACGLSRLKNHSALLVRFAVSKNFGPQNCGAVPRMSVQDKGAARMIEDYYGCFSLFPP